MALVNAAARVANATPNLILKENDMSATIEFVNDTQDLVKFGLFNGWGSNAMIEEVSASKTKKATMQNANARTIAAWINDETLFPNNQSAFMKGFLFQDKQTYTVTLSADGLTIVAD